MAIRGMSELLRETKNKEINKTNQRSEVEFCMKNKNK